jgi:hypothetical protein
MRSKRLRDLDRFMVRRSSVLAALLLAVTLIGLPAAKANVDCTNDAGGSEQNWWCPENDHQRYWWSAGLTGDWLAAAKNSRTEDINPTDMDTTVVASHSDSDVAVYTYTNVDDNRSGFTKCIDPSGDLCLHWHVNYNLSTSHTTMAHKNFVACQEFGHATGLHHQQNDPGDSCMNDTHIHVGVLDDHDRSHINTNTFPP